MSDKGTILVVDDDILTHELLKAMLAPKEYLIVSVLEGQQALKRALEIVPDLVILDVMMPDIDGFEVCRLIRANPILNEVPVIMLTALDDPESRTKGIEAGVDDFIPKPYDEIELTSRVQSIMRLNRYRRQLAERQKFNWVIEQDSDGYVIVDAYDRIEYLNPAARILLDISNDIDVTSLIFLDSVESTHHCEPQEAWSTWPATHDSLPLYLIRPDTSNTTTQWIKVETVPMTWLETAQKLIRLRNVTRQVTVCSDMRSFHGAVAHKLNTPLCIILNGLEDLQDYLAGGGSNEAKEMLDVVRSGAQRLSNEISDILTYITAPNFVRSGPKITVSNFLQIAKENVLQLGIEVLRTETDGVNLDQKMMLSRQSCELVLWEILENSKKYHPQNAPEIDIIIHADNDVGQLVIKILDNGSFITSDQLAKCWVPYTQEEKYFTGQKSGMGLGLSSVATVIWRTGGTCRISNRQTPGVIVELVIPMVEVESEQDGTLSVTSAC